MQNSNRAFDAGFMSWCLPMTILFMLSGVVRLLAQVATGPLAGWVGTPPVMPTDDGDVSGDLPDHLIFDEDGLPKGYTIIDGDILVSRSSVSRGIYVTNLWTDGVVAFRFENNITASQRAIAMSAMDIWENLANVDFQLWTSEFHHLFFHDSASDPIPANYAPPGRQPGPQPIVILNWDVPTIVHELGHVLGFWHEQQRHDRDSNIMIVWNNISGDTKFNFATPPGTYDYGPYDFGSIMQYDQCAFSNCGAGCPSALPACRTMIVLPPNDVQWQNMIGNAMVPSFWDARVMSFLYSYDDWVFIDQANDGFQEGTFLLPFNNWHFAVEGVPEGGTIWIQPGEYETAETLSKRMTLRAPIGGVTLR